VIFAQWVDANSGKYLTVEPLDSGGIKPTALIKLGSNINSRYSQWVEVAMPDGSMRYHCRTSSQVIDARGGTLNDNDPLQQYIVDADNGVNQHWDLQLDGQAFIVLAHGTSVGWAIPDGATADGAQVVVVDLRESDAGSKLWVRQVTDDIPAFRFTNVASGLVLDVPSGTQDDNQIQQYPDHGGIASGQTNQAFEIVDVDGTNYLIRSICSGNVLSVRPDDLAASRAGLGWPRPWQVNDQGADWQLWTMAGYRNGGSTTEIISKAAPDLCLDVIDFTTLQGFNVQLHSINHGSNQQWNITPHL